MRGRVVLGLLLGLSWASAVAAEVYYKETFDENWHKRWKRSTWKQKEVQDGVFHWSAGQWHGDPEADKGIQTVGAKRFYTLWTKVKKPFHNEGKDLVLQYSVKHEQEVDCAGGYIKLVGESVVKDSMKHFGGVTPYLIMFGPDICGPHNQRLHVILPYKGKNHLIKKEREPKAVNDRLTHVYTLHIKPDNSYQIFIDMNFIQGGTLEDDWEMLPPKKIKDPKAKKPADWIDLPTMPDPTDKQPDDWDDEPELIPDDTVEKPEDWDEQEDGEWTPPLVRNAKWKGIWGPRYIPNPNYKGEWKHPEVPNPAFRPDPKLYMLPEAIKWIGFDIWQVKSGTIFDNIIITDSLKEAFDFAKETWGKGKKKEKEMHDAAMKEEEAKKPNFSLEDDEYEDPEPDEEEEEEIPAGPPHLRREALERREERRRAAAAAAAEGKEGKKEEGKKDEL